jgi:hypothetical protein
MLKPRWPIEECDVPPPSSGSTPSSSTSSFPASNPSRPTSNSNSNHSPAAPTPNATHTAGGLLAGGKKKKKRFELDFVHLDPVLSVHMRVQSLSMLGRGVIEFIHPEERERESEIQSAGGISRLTCFFSRVEARRDLYSSTQQNNLEGSVTR